MHLVERLPWQESVTNKQPLRLDLTGVTIPQEVDFMLIGTRHDTDAGTPDYLPRILPHTDVLFLEYVHRNNRTGKRLQAIADGSYSALQEEAKELGITHQTAGSTQKWIMTVCDQVYGSRIRFIPTDYPRRHHALDKLDHMINSSDFDINLAQPLFLQRDMYTSQHMMGSIAELRKWVPSLREKQPLRVVALLGAAHYAIGESLQHAAQAQNVGSFTLKTVFEETASMATDYDIANNSPSWLAQARKDMIDYQNWLRSTPEAAN